MQHDNNMLPARSAATFANHTHTAMLCTNADNTIRKTTCSKHNSAFSMDQRNNLYSFDIQKLTWRLQQYSRQLVTIISLQKASFIHFIYTSPQAFFTTTIYIAARCQRGREYKQCLLHRAQCAVRVCVCYRWSRGIRNILCAALRHAPCASSQAATANHTLALLSLLSDVSHHCQLSLIFKISSTEKREFRTVGWLPILIKKKRVARVGLHELARSTCLAWENKVDGLPSISTCDLRWLEFEIQYQINLSNVFRKIKPSMQMTRQAIK